MLASKSASSAMPTRQPAVGGFPATGRPARTCWRTVSVAAASCVGANIATTAAILRGERAIPWLEGLGLPARLVRHDGTVVTVAGWPRDSEDRPG